LKTYFLLFTVVFLFIHSASSQPISNQQLKFDKNKKVYELETACGTCMFKMKGKGCVLAVKYNDSAYFVKGINIDDHGDAHAKDGFCNAIKKAKIQGELKDNIFWVTYFEILTPKK
jgi:hypothetical protein